MKGRALIVFARSLKSGQVKSRLTKLISAQEATDLYRMFLMDSLKQYASLNVAVRLYMSDGIPPDIPVYGAVIKQQCGKGAGRTYAPCFSGDEPQQDIGRWSLLGPTILRYRMLSSKMHFMHYRIRQVYASGPQKTEDIIFWE